MKADVTSYLCYYDEKGPFPACVHFDADGNRCYNQFVVRGIYFDSEGHLNRERIQRNGNTFYTVYEHDEEGIFCPGKTSHPMSTHLNTA